jgi:UDP-N-acetylmuramate--alanine ligase
MGTVMKKISFCGISGSGMSSLAQIMYFSGYEVRGSDRNFDLNRDQKTKQALENLGIRIFPQDGSAITDDLDFICTSTAVEDSIADIKAAKAKHIPIKTRPQLLSEVFHSFRYGIAVGGTSGKTTTTAMIGYIMDKAGQKPCMINGGLLRNYENQKGIPNVILNKGDTCIVEADESNGSIELYNPYISLINNISQDHKTLDELLELFKNLALRTKYAVVVNDDNELCRRIRHNRKLVFSLQNPQADFYASEITPVADGTLYTFCQRRFKLRLIGEFNVANALAAIATCSLMGVDKIKAAEILQDFSGTKRRLEVIGQKNDITVIDDFAHNPDKIKASVSALRQYSGRLIIMFQPHGFAPMRSLGKQMTDEFVARLLPEDILIMPEIFFAGGTVTKDISAADYIAYARSRGKDNAFYFPDKEQAAEFILQNAKSGDRIVIMGARDNSLTDLCYYILENLK